MLKIDHVSIAGSRLDELEAGFHAAGFTTQYGGPHSNGITHMDVIGFPDGSYIELIAAREPGARAPSWTEHIAGDGGPCAWAVQTHDIAAESARVAALGLPVEGPYAWTRQRPDGQTAAWQMTFIGKPGATLPFLIQDTTPRSVRVEPTPGIADLGLTGVALVVIGVTALDPVIAAFRKVYGWQAPRMAEDVEFGARTATFPDSPVALAAPLNDHSGLNERLARFGESPCAFLLRAPSLDAVKVKLTTPRPGFERRLAWIAPQEIGGKYLGVFAEDQLSSQGE